MGKVVIIEPNPTGHRLRYATKIIEALLEYSDKHIVLITTEIANAPHFQRYLKLRQNDRFRCRIVKRMDIFDKARAPSLWKRLRLSFHALSTYRKWAALESGDEPAFVFVPYLDICWPALAVSPRPFGPGVPWWGGIIMRQRFHHASMGLRTPPRWIDAPEKLAWRLVLARSEAIFFTLDPYLPRWMEQRWPRFAGRITHLVDPLDPVERCGREAARQQLGLPSGAFVLLVYGAIDERKGLRLLAEACERPDWPEEVLVLVVGDGASRLEPLLPNIRSRHMLRAVDRFIDEDEEAVIFSAADAVWVAYEQHYTPSGVLVQAAQAGLPVLVRPEGVIGALVSERRFGFCVETAAEVNVALRSLTSYPTLQDELRSNARAAFSDYTTFTFGKQIHERLGSSTEIWANRGLDPNVLADEAF